MLFDTVFSQPYLLLAVSLFLLMLEFFLPGGILAVISAIIYLLGFIQAFNSFDGVSLAMYSLAATLLPVLTIFLTLKRITRSGDKNTFYLSKDQEGYIGASFDSSLIGKVGAASTDLGPSGFAIIDGKRVQVVSQSGYIEKGTAIKVVQGRGAYLVVMSTLETV